MDGRSRLVYLNSLPEHQGVFHNYRDELVMEENMPIRLDHARPEVRRRIHSSHIGLQGCLRRTRGAMFWPNMNRDITASASACSVCAKIQTSRC